MPVLVRLLVIPHITDAIMAWVKEVSKKPVTGTTEEPDICIVEVRSLPNALCLGAARPDACHMMFAVGCIAAGWHGRRH